MGRGKLTLELIEKEKARMITYQKRKKGLKKKAQEFTTLCGVPACMIIYGPRLSGGSSDVEIWPTDQKEFMEVVNLYRDKALSSVRGVKSQNLYDFFADRNKKVYEKIVKTQKANFESKFSSDLDNEDMMNNLSIHQLKEMLNVFDNNIDVATRKLALLKGHHQKISQVEYPLLQPQPQPFNHYHHQHQALQMVPFEFNPIDNDAMMAMMLMNGGDHHQIHQMDTAPYYNHHRHRPMHHAMYYDLPSGSMMMNNHRANAAVRFVGSTMQQLPTNYDQFPALPSIASQMHGSQFNGFCSDINEFYHKREKL